jgi:integrase
MIPAARDLFMRLRAKAETDEIFAPEGEVFLVSECGKSLSTACVQTKADRITHHDLRHLFATACIESGVDIPTVARWLGHADGGALAMRTYGHLRDEHSQASAKKVTFGGGS